MRIFLAPMEGVVDHHMRNIISSVGGVDICVTEFIRVTDHVLPNKIFKKACPELDENSETPALYRGAHCPVRVQLLGSNPSALAANAARAAELGAVAIDLNFGCPAKTVNRHKGGACLLDETDTVFDIVNAVRKATPASTPVTAKIRLGYLNRDSYLRNAKAIEAAGANELCVHARSKTDGYQPPAYWHYIGDIRDNLSIPVVANGEIWSLEDFKRCAEQSKCSDFMLGRGLLAKPDLALEIKQYMAGEAFNPLSWDEVCAHVRTLFERNCQSYPPKYLGNRVKQWLFYLQRQYSEAAELFEAIKRERDEQALRRALGF
ncbi:tRNA dihydrouridine synthase [Saccharophagus degradans]|uniref:tRNA-dihydrouridine(16) synthase n=1 Tax=Saccharophagus degradans (strain 2-40 / ATCC 43961 / DSM 17024) TaxID=203122 RepID=Q21L63_SACD2|nr:tRNA-dihydrouridine synthase family protein [Saccharophagus degradans]ABD80566.1 dihydrouridine synthase, DuS [Saccharophagus degradans 2-40]